MTNRSKYRGIVASALLVLLLTSCGEPRDEASREVTSQPAEPAAFFDLVRHSNEGFDRATPVYETVGEAMPNRTFVIDGGPPHSIADLYVVGPVESVDAGVGLLWEFDEDGENERRIAVEFGDDRAVVNTVHVTVRPTRVITDGLIEEPDGPVTFGLAFSDPIDLEEISAELRSYEAIAALLYEPSPFDYVPGLWGVLEDGAMVGVVSNDGLTVDFRSRPPTPTKEERDHALDPEHDPTDHTHPPHDERTTEVRIEELEVPRSEGTIFVATDPEGGWMRQS